MEYKVTLTPQAAEQIHQTAFYISHTLLEPETARHWMDFLQKEIASLNAMPARYPLTEEEPWRTYGIRKMTVKIFSFTYLVDEEHKQVSATAVVYGRRDQLSELLDMPFN